MSPLQNKQILLTRPKEQSSALQRELENRGAIVHLATLIRTQLIESEATKSAIQALPDFDWVVFTSRNGVEYLYQTLYRMGRQLPANLQIAAIGQTTAAALEKIKGKATLVPESANSESLIKALEQTNVEGKKIVLFQAEKTRDLLPAALTKLGAQVTEVALYRTAPDPLGIQVLKILPWGKIDAIVFMSSSAATVFAATRPETAKTSRAKCCAVGPVTAQRMKELGLPVHLVAPEASGEGIIQVLEKGL